MNNAVWYAAQPEHCHGWWIVSTDPDGEDCVDDSGDGGFEEWKAHLIAAAPEMLALVKRVAEGERSDEGHTAIREHAVALVAKAEGRTVG